MWMEELGGTEEGEDWLRLMNKEMRERNWVKEKQIGHYKRDMTHKKRNKNRDELMDIRTPWKNVHGNKISKKKKKTITQKHSLEK